MATTPTTGEREELLEVEERALERLEEEGLAEPTEEPEEEEEEEIPVPAIRLALVVGFSILAAAVMVGGIFREVGPRFFAALAGILGIGVGIFAARIQRTVTAYAAIIGGVFATGFVISVTQGSFQDIINPAPFVREAIEQGGILRPPVEFSLGWSFILGWLMAALGFSAAWIAIALKRPSLGFIAPIIVVPIAAISVGDEGKIASGLLALVFFATGLGILSGVDVGEREQRSVAYELRRAIRALPLVGLITGLLYVMAVNNFLFPQPRFDPTQEAQRPKTVPLSEVPDRVLFTVRSSITGPWRMGSLDIYEQKDGEWVWLLPPFAENRIEEVPRDGVVDSELQAGIKAFFETVGISGAVLPGLPNSVGLVAEGPRLAFDFRTGNIRLAEGTVQPGLEYAVTAGRIPSVEELQNVTADPSDLECTPGVRCEEYMEIPDAPPAVARLISEAPKGSKWDTLDYVRNQLLDTVVAAGAGTPVPIPPETVDDMLVGSQEASPYEIVAAQAMIARWVGIPSRIGYGFDGGDEAGDVVEVRPEHGASFLEVYFPGYKWLPIIGTPRQARTSLGSENVQEDTSVLASDDIGVKVFVPFQTDPRTFLFEQIRAILIVVVPLILAILLAYYSWPAVRKAYLRGRRRAWAGEQGMRERIAVAYADWRDLATDFGYQYASDTPLMFLGRVVEDEEHTEFAWLITRCLWGDLQSNVTPAEADAAEELSRSLRKRMSQAHTFTLRTVAAVSRLSLRFPYAPSLGPQKQRKPARRGAPRYAAGEA
jgi:hypothetical protein